MSIVVSHNLDVRQRIIDEANSGDFTLFDKLAADFNVTIDDLNLEFTHINIDIKIPIYKVPEYMKAAFLKERISYLEEILSSEIYEQIGYHNQSIWETLCPELEQFESSEDNSGWDLCVEAASHSTISVKHPPQDA